VCLTLGVILYYYILLLLYTIIHYYYYILYYTIIYILYLILYYTILFSSVLHLSSFSFSSYSSILLSHSPLLLFPSSLPIFYSSSSLPNHPNIPLIHSILVGTYIYLFIFQTHLSSSHPVSVRNTHHLPFPLPNLLSIFCSPHHTSTSHSFYTCRYLHILIYIPSSSSLFNSDPARSIGVDG
jgi:hypothetical protein